MWRRCCGGDASHPRGQTCTGWDLAARLALSDKAAFSHPAMLADIVGVALDESRHFLMLESRMRALSISYGDLPAHTVRHRGVPCGSSGLTLSTLLVSGRDCGTK